MRQEPKEFSLASFADRDGRTVVAVRGELDAYTAPRFRDQVAALVHQGRTEVTVDLHEVEFVDSSGLSALIAAHKQLRRLGGDLVLLAPTAAVFRVLEISGLTRIFNFADRSTGEMAGPATA